MKVSAVIAQLRTTDLDASIQFYTRLGMTLEFRYQDFYAGIRAGGQMFHLKRSDEADPSIGFVAHNEHFHLYFEIDDVDALACLFRGQGIGLVRDVSDTPWGTRECVIRDDQGHTLYFGEPSRRRAP